MESIISALVAGGLTLIGTVLTVSSGQKKTRAEASDRAGGHRLQKLTSYARGALNIIILRSASQLSKNR